VKENLTPHVVSTPARKHEQRRGVRSERLLQSARCSATRRSTPARHPNAAAWSSGNVPPAKPGLLGCEPLKAAEKGRWRVPSSLCCLRAAHGPRGLSGEIDITRWSWPNTAPHRTLLSLSRPASQFAWILLNLKLWSLRRHLEMNTKPFPTLSRSHWNSRIVEAAHSTRKPGYTPVKSNFYGHPGKAAGTLKLFSLGGFVAGLSAVSNFVETFCLPARIVRAATSYRTSRAAMWDTPQRWRKPTGIVWASISFLGGKRSCGPFLGTRACPRSTRFSQSECSGRRLLEQKALSSERAILRWRVLRSSCCLLWYWWPLLPSD